jgi:hypothetical protein
MQAPSLGSGTSSCKFKPLILGQTQTAADRLYGIYVYHSFLFQPSKHLQHIFPRVRFLITVEDVINRRTLFNEGEEATLLDGKKGRREIAFE